ncbi:AAA family ATPase [Gymnodinialimonas sp. 2305UL16-5]|uniref:AAA family ATPase n=1 Tax=Gymnodinialimonas mytili TaxID=3126503 RepID=UPI0030AD00FA
MIPRPGFVILSGCSGGGKSTLLAALAETGLSVVPEPGRRIIEAGGPDPARDPMGFARMALELSLSDYAEAFALPAPVIFDRGLVDAAVNLAHQEGRALDTSLLAAHPFAQTMFMAQPWPEIYVTDAARRHSLSEGIAEYGRLCAAYSALGYKFTFLPKTDITARVAYLRHHLSPV